MRFVLLLLAAGLVLAAAPVAEAHEITCVVSEESDLVACVVECSSHLLELTGDACRLQL